MPYYILIVLLSLYIGYMIRGVYERRKSFDGDILVTEKDGITLYSLELNANPEEIKTKKEITFAVKIPTEESVRE